MGVNSLPKTVTRQRHGCDLNTGPFAPESSTLTTRLPSHPLLVITVFVWNKLREKICADQQTQVYLEIVHYICMFVCACMCVVCQTDLFVQKYC